VIVWVSFRAQIVHDVGLNVQMAVVPILAVRNVHVRLLETIHTFGLVKHAIAVRSRSN
jgi:hypothetical protein